MSDSGRHQIAGILGCEPERLDKELDTLAARAKSRALKLRITGEVRDRARNGRYAFVHDRGRDFAAGIWVVDPAFMIDLVQEQIQDDGTAPAREEAYFAGARIDDDELRDAAAEDEQRRAQARARHADATRSNLGLGHDIRAGLIEPTDSPAPRAQADRLPPARPPLPRADRLRRRLDRPRTPAARRRHRPPRAAPRRRDHRRRARARARRPRPAARASPSSPPAGQPRSCSTPPASPAPRRSAQSGWRASSRDALPGGDSALRAAVWEFMRPMLSPALVALNRDAFVADESARDDRRPGRTPSCVGSGRP